MKFPVLDGAIANCIVNGKRLQEDARLLLDFDRNPSALSVAILAQEEFAKAFLLILARRKVLPWTPEFQRALRSHECKHLAGVMIEWLGPSLDEALSRARKGIEGKGIEYLPPDVAVALNILRHEKFERFRRGYSDKHPEDGGASRKIAEGLLDRIKQRGLVRRPRQKWHGLF
ncbi:MAG: AbiV family abortive infection protein [Cellvibrionaceae bacterium]|nr:AbiV family abortive infection protein [Cellvibrionaceae bacterium]